MKGYTIRKVCVKKCSSQELDFFKKSYHLILMAGNKKARIYLQLLHP